MNARRKKQIARVLRTIGAVPEYSEPFLFAIAVALIALFAIDSEFRSFVGRFVSDLGFGELVVTLVAVFGGIGLAIYYAFAKRKISSTAKSLLILFIVLIECPVAAAAAFHLATTGAFGFRLIFPAMNILHIAVLAVGLHVGVIGEHSISDEQAPWYESVIAGLTTIVLLLVVHYSFREHWSIAFSMSVTYAAFVSERVGAILLRLFDNRNDTRLSR
ncbi:MAG: hypothetical protein ABIG71_01260 [Candidatus Uhrbacteria bacterium]